MDQIRIDNLEIYAKHGAFTAENELGQPFYLNAVLYTDTQKAGESDELEYSTHYGYVCEEMKQLMTRQTWKLIESVAEHVAEGVLLKFPLVRAIDLEVRKPRAPIPMHFESVSVKIHRSWHQVYLSVGSNMGDQEAHIREAVKSLSEQDKIRAVKVSELVRTTPYGEVSQPDFLNGAIELETLLSPMQLLETLHVIEAKQGRVRKEHWGPRTLDLDILLYDMELIHESQLDIPHVDMQNREFVLAPLCELNPWVKHPGYQKTAAELLQLLRENQGMEQGRVIRE